MSPKQNVDILLIEYIGCARVELPMEQNYHRRRQKRTIPCRTHNQRCLFGAFVRPLDKHGRVIEKIDLVALVGTAVLPRPLRKCTREIEGSTAPSIAPREEGSLVGIAYVSPLVLSDALIIPKTEKRKQGA